jgi:hypothetical protein
MREAGASSEASGFRNFWEVAEAERHHPNVSRPQGSQADMTLARASAHLVRAYLHPKRDEAAARPGDPLGTNVLRDVHWAIRVEADSRRSAVRFE